MGCPFSIIVITMEFSLCRLIFAGFSSSQYSHNALCLFHVRINGFPKDEAGGLFLIVKNEGLHLFSKQEYNETELFLTLIINYRTYCVSA